MKVSDGSTTGLLIGIWIDEGDGGHILDVLAEGVLLEDGDAVVEPEGVLPRPLVLLHQNTLDHVRVALELQTAVFIPERHLHLDLIHRVAQYNQLLLERLSVLTGKGLYLSLILHQTNHSYLISNRYFGKFLDSDAEILHVGYCRIVFFETDLGMVVDGHF